MESNLRRRAIGVLAALSVTVGCATNPRPVPEPPIPVPTSYTVVQTVVQPNRADVPGLVCTLIVDVLGPVPCAYHDFRAFFTVPVDKRGFGVTVHYAADGFLSYDSARFVLNVDLGEVILKPKPVRRARAGVVRLDHRVFVDDDGPFLGVGATCFWCAWAFEHDRAKLDANLACVAGLRPNQPGCPHTSVDYIRVLGSVGPGGGWGDRLMDSRSPTFAATIAGLTDHAYDDFGLRIEWTIFGGIETTPTAADRAAVVAKFVAMAQGRFHKIMFWEPANEGTLNGFGGEDGKAELWRLAKMLREGTPNITALTSPQGDSDPIAWYAGSPANLWTAHLDRSTNGTGGMFRPIRQPRDMVDQPFAWTSNEPIGIDSSVADDSDPVRLTLSAIYTWLCRGAGYVAHSGAGIRGGGAADVARGRQTDFWKQPTFAAQIDGMNAIRAALPADLPNFPSWQNNNNGFPGYPFETNPLLDAGEDKILRAFCALSADARFVCVPIAVTAPIPFVARRAMTFDVLDPTSAAVRAHIVLQPGQTYLQPPAPGAVFVGRFR